MTGLEEQVAILQSRLEVLEALHAGEIAQTRCGKCGESLHPWELPQEPRADELVICNSCTLESLPPAGTLDKGLLAGGESFSDGDAA